MNFQRIQRIQCIGCVGCIIVYKGERTMSQIKEKKYQVFISSTYEDLQEERAAVSKTLLDLGFIPVGMEQFPASEMGQMEYIEKMLEYPQTL